MLRKYHKRLVVTLLILLAVFVAIFALAFADLHLNKEIVDFGMPGLTENYIVLILSIFAIAKAVWEIHRLEHPSRLA